MSEALSLSVSDVDAPHNCVTVKCGKGGKMRTVGVDDGVFERIALWLEHRQRLGLSGRTPLFCTLQGRRMSYGAVNAMLRRRAAKANVERRVNPHAFRHTFAAELMREGWVLTEIQDQLGHVSLDQTAAYLQRIAPVELAAKAKQRPAWE